MLLVIFLGKKKVLPITANSMMRKQKSVVELIYCAGWPFMTEEQINLPALWYEAATFGSRVGEQIGGNPPSVAAA